MKSTIPFVCAALVGTSLITQPSNAERGAIRDPHTTQARHVYFGFDSSALPAELPDLAPLATWAEEHPGGTIVLDGVTDSIGAADYNVGLAIRRAEAVRGKLVELGVDADRIVLAIYGEAAPRRETAALDRRVTAWTTDAPLAAIVDLSLLQGTAVLWSKPVSYAELHPMPPEVASR
jgi:outer membrane protein OmpA-like peptidoglycan-associated protein